MKENILSTTPVQTIAKQARCQSHKRNIINFQSPFLLHRSEISDQGKNVTTNAKAVAENRM
jgi:hypothetical protein